MADTLEFEIKEYADIKNEFPYWNGKFKILDKIYKKGKRPILIHAKLIIDTLADAIGEIQDPTNDVLDFTSFKQIYFRSSNAGDTSKSVYVIGQKSTGEFGLFTFTTDDTDGSTPVDEGEWAVIYATIPIDTFAGNAIIDDDGASSTVYFTMALGADDKTGIIYVPDGYYGAILEAKLKSTGVAGFIPTDTADTVPDVVMAEIGDEVRLQIDLNHPIDKDGGTKVFAGQEQIKLEFEYENAVIDSICDIWILLWSSTK